MSTELTFDATDVPPASTFEVLPKDTYQAIISDTEMKDTKSGTGQYLQCEYTITEGEYEGRKLWSRHNLVNPNKTAEEIARKELSAICHAVGVLKVTDSAELHDIPLEIVVGVGKNKDTGDATNEIKGWAAVEGAPAPAKPAAKAPPAKPAAAKAPPWAKKAAA